MTCPTCKGTGLVATFNGYGYDFCTCHEGKKKRAQFEVKKPAQD